MYKYILYWTDDGYETKSMEVTDYWDILASDIPKSRLAPKIRPFATNKTPKYKFDWTDSNDSEHEVNGNNTYLMDNNELKYVQRLSKSDYFLLKVG